MPEIKTVRDQIAWSYANLARAHAALEDGSTRYQRTHHIIRNKLFKGLCSGRMSMRSLYDDERLKMIHAQQCVYCGCASDLCLDHMIPRTAGGRDWPQNLVWACRACNSSKQGRDMLRWMQAKGRFPSVFVLRRYLKIVAEACAALNLMDEPLETAVRRDLPFALELLPMEFPPLMTLTLWVTGGSRADTPSALDSATGIETS